VWPKITVTKLLFGAGPQPLTSTSTSRAGTSPDHNTISIALMALGVDSRDELITPPFTFVATAGSISRLKARPVFVDIDTATTWTRIAWKRAVEQEPYYKIRFAVPNRSL
jgi:hypothetical protein